MKEKNKRLFYIVKVERKFERVVKHSGCAVVVSASPKADYRAVCCQRRRWEGKLWLFKVV